MPLPRSTQNLRFTAMWSPLNQLKSWYTLCTAKQKEIHLCHENDMSNHAQFFVDFSVFASTQFLPYHLTEYLQFYTLHGVDNNTMKEAREHISKTMTKDFAGTNGLYQVGTFLLHSWLDHILEEPSPLMQSFPDPKYYYSVLPINRRTTRCTAKLWITALKR